MASQPAQSWQSPTPEPRPGMAAQPAANSMATHVKVVAILELVWGVLSAIIAVILLFAFGIATAATGAGGAPSFVPGFLAGFGIFLAFLVAALAALALLAGFKLLRHKRSGRTLTYVTAALSLLSFPFGTAFGVYAFIIMTRPDTDRLLVD